MCGQIAVNRYPRVIDLVPIRSGTFRSKELKAMRSSNRLKSVVLASALGLFLATTAFATTSNAATIKNGVACKKNNLKTKAGGKNYICGKNPYVTPTKLTWMLRECPETYDLYADSKEQYEIFKDILSSAGAEGKIEADKLIKGIGDLEVLMKSQVCKKGK
jgi:hypothetical protein